eukprot:12687301-Alexandrium_andersonii.AAC.1
MVPTGVLWAKRELFKLPRHLAALAFNLKHWSPQERTGLLIFGCCVVLEHMLPILMCNVCLFRGGVA